MIGVKWNNYWNLIKQIGNQLIVVKKNGENNILSAVNIYDEILGDSYGYVLSNKEMQKKEWTRAKKRAKNIN